MVYRITVAKYAGRLAASGSPARWNSRDVNVIYTAATRALACLENIVHRNSIGVDAIFRTMLINIPDHLHIETINKADLPTAWRRYENMTTTQQIGDD